MAQRFGYNWSEVDINAPQKLRDIRSEWLEVLPYTDGLLMTQLELKLKNISARGRWSPENMGLILTEMRNGVVDDVPQNYHTIFFEYLSAIRSELFHSAIVLILKHLQSGVIKKEYKQGIFQRVEHAFIHYQELCKILYDFLQAIIKAKKTRIRDPKYLALLIKESDNCLELMAFDKNWRWGRW